MMITNKCKLVVILFVSNLMCACEKERPLTLTEMAKSWKLYAQIKYFPVDGNKNELAQNVEILLKQGALPTIFFERDITALSLAQLKKLDGVVAIMKPEDPLHQVWQELERKGFIKSKL